MLKPRRRPGMLGLTMRENVIRLLHLKKMKRQFFIQQVATREVQNAGLIENQTVTWNKVTSEVADVVLKYHLQGLPIAISLPASLVWMQRISMPSALNAKDMEREILSKHINDHSFALNELNMDISRLGLSKNGYADIFYVATGRHYLQQYAQAIKDAGLLVKVVDVDVYALVRAVSYVANLTPELNENLAIVHVTSEQVLFVCFDSRHILFYQQWPIDKNNLCYSQLQARIQFNLASHENIKIHKIIFCCAEDEYQAMQQMLSSFCAVCHYCPLSFEGMMSDVDMDLIKNPHFDWWVALGLAMREAYA